ncbi:sensor histidine kinase [Deinococcus sedimenti]|uniref:histidine kinase n=1 Tax=Deinococcus sedimenti TaxID=1867090 RepID=A0ABQ2S5I1_9DEIO|nr:ATP-binding protein [Deinococcus sedimenti]GGR92600.1 hybrid sensor histidine kinase/response regulator [Deinococcus sedimenti]
MPQFQVPPAKVLIVDDQDSKRIGLAAALDQLGHEVVMASSGREALRYLLTHEVAVILLDVRMPELDGFETAALIRTRRQSETTPIIFVTAYTHAESDMLSGYTHGAVDFIFSPIQPEILRAKVQVFVDLYRHAHLAQAHERRLRDLEAQQARLELHKLSSALEQSADPVVITDALGHVEYVNAAFSANVGRRAADLTGRPLATLHPAAEGSTDLQALWAQVRAGHVQRAEVTYHRPDGAPYHQATTVTPLTDETGAVTHFIITGHDVSERKRLEAEMQALNASLEARVRERTAQLQEVNEEIEAYAYSISHDLRTPLRHIMSFADLLARSAGETLPAKSRAHLERIRSSAHRMSELIDRLLDFARTGRHQLTLQPIELGTLLDELISDYQRDPTAPPIRWEVAPLPTVTADLISLRELLGNLISNAVKYARDAEGGPHIQVQATQTGGFHHVSVTDNGVGFDMAYSHKLFTVFQRLHTYDRFEGHGVGLAHVKRIIVRHGGTVRAHSAEGQGATFTFTLPVEPISPVDVPQPT